MEFNITLTPIIERALFNILILLGLTALFGAAMSYLGSYLNPLPINFWVCGISYLAVMFIMSTIRKLVTPSFLMCFFLTGWIAFSLGQALIPIVGIIAPMYVVALCLQAAIMCTLMAFHVVMTKQTFGVMLTFSNVSLIMIPISIVIGLIVDVPAVVMVIGMIITVSSCAYIMDCLKSVIYGKETNYFLTVVKTYLRIYDFVFDRIESAIKRLTKA